MSDTIQVLFGTETGNAEFCGERLVKTSRKQAIRLSWSTWMTSSPNPSRMRSCLYRHQYVWQR